METELENKFYKLIGEEDERPEALQEAADLVLNAPESSERAGLLALIYHDGIGVEQDIYVRECRDARPGRGWPASEV